MTVKPQTMKAESALRAKQAIDLRVAGWTPDEIAAELKISRRSVHRLIDRYIRRAPLEGAEILRDRLNARYDRAHKAATKHLDAKGKLSLDAARTVAFIASKQARLNHLEQEAPIIIAPTIHVRYDLSALAPEELEAYHALRRKVVVVREEVVDAQLVEQPKALPPKPEEP